MEERVKPRSRSDEAVTPSGGEGGTRNQILVVASNLFAIHGYHGTTTREIAEGVGVRQPSLFHHFPTKAAMMEALLEHDLATAVPAAETIARSPDPPSVRMYRYLWRDVTHLATSVYNLAGVYTEEVRASEEFEPWHRRRHQLHQAIEMIVRDGQRVGEFIDFPAEFVRESILGVIGRTLVSYSGGRAPLDPRLPDDVSTLILRGLLLDPSRMNEIRDAALTDGPRPS